jgi:hypothetical protein
LQRKVKHWRATEGPAQEVYFVQEHRAGELCASDFTHFSRVFLPWSSTAAIARSIPQRATLFKYRPLPSSSHRKDTYVRLPMNALTGPERRLA